MIRVPAGGDKPVLYEGDPYLGCWLESTGSVSADILSRFAPGPARNTFELFPDCQRPDGLYPVTVRDTAGPVYSQLQTVSPIARTVWNHYLMHGKDRGMLEKMYHSMVRFDRWIETAGTPGIPVASKRSVPGIRDTIIPPVSGMLKM